jgi:hypothetical protein
MKLTNLPLVATLAKLNCPGAFSLFSCLQVASDARTRLRVFPPRAHDKVPAWLDKTRID